MTVQKEKRECLVFGGELEFLLVFPRLKGLHFGSAKIMMVGRNGVGVRRRDLPSVLSWGHRTHGTVLFVARVDTPVYW